MRKGPDGRLWAINPENGFFGVARVPTKVQSKCVGNCSKGTIYTNVALNLDNDTVWWEGLDKNPPKNGVDWTGKPWDGTTAEEKVLIQTAVLQLLLKIVLVLVRNLVHQPVCLSPQLFLVVVVKNNSIGVSVS